MEGLWDKYSVPLSIIFEKRQQIASKLNAVLKEVGYVC